MDNAKLQRVVSWYTDFERVEAMYPNFPTPKAEVIDYVAERFDLTIIQSTFVYERRYHQTHQPAV